MNGGEGVAGQGLALMPLGVPVRRRFRLKRREVAAPVRVTYAQPCSEIYPALPPPPCDFRAALPQHGPGLQCSSTVRDRPPRALTCRARKLSGLTNWSIVVSQARFNSLVKYLARGT
jgi:hypothetical protein